jgi:hypothetical protein
MPKHTASLELRRVAGIANNNMEDNQEKLEDRRVRPILQERVATKTGLLAVAVVVHIAGTFQGNCVLWEHVTLRRLGRGLWLTSSRV